MSVTLVLSDGEWKTLQGMMDRVVYDILHEGCLYEDDHRYEHARDFVAKIKQKPLLDSVSSRV